MPAQFDRAKEDLGNIFGLEHINVTVPDQQAAIEFYVTGCGFTRDPYIMTGTNNMWINIGNSQIHMPTAKPQVLRGHTGIVVPNLEEAAERLESVKQRLADTKFSYAQHNDHVDATCPWGNLYRLYAPDEERFGAINLGMPYVEFAVPAGTAEGIVRFYRQIMGTMARVEGNGEGKVAHVSVGKGQELVFRETDDALADYDGHHVAVYVQDFSGPHKRLLERKLITEESDPWQYRFLDIVDPDDGKHLFRIEHEVRSLTHPLFGRPFVNRNPAQSNRNYRPGRDAWAWSAQHPPGSTTVSGVMVRPPAA